MADSRDDEVPDVKAEPSDISERQKDFTRRALIRAGWVVPMVTAIKIPEASAQSVPPHNDVHGDAPHPDSDAIHTDVHLDTAPPAHTDHSDHADTPHTDSAAHRRAAHGHAAHRRAAR